MVKILQSFRLKMIVLFYFSMLVSTLISFLFFKLFQALYRTMVNLGNDLLLPLYSFITEIGEITFFLVIFIPLSIFFFFLFTKPYENHLNEISKGIHYLARGDFAHRVEIYSNDEFRVIAQDINLASNKLKEATERGDLTESSKDQLVVNLAHDLRTPLTSVLGYLDLIINDKHLTDEQRKHFLTIAFTKSQRLEKLIDELFEITQMNYGMLTIDNTQVNLSELLIQLNEEMYPVFEKNYLAARLDISPNLQIIGDGELLARVFENLLTNANRYGYDGKYVDINGFVNSGDVVIQIVNYGDHIPADELPYLFDMFYTGDKARTHKKDSTGLGLFIAKNIVEQHNGTISVESSLERTLFEVRLPRVDISTDEV
ncbi:HAMP domain-containing sensor histidine kinase [Bacillus sp. SM2101]|uniref:sensor histidine kinase n=1 Tax=Bacillus sp. SM2101 TaxID=2805366 RepID=UPI001BDE6DB2|nr:HAMP domain-containing sensor histidine kinase [Bacillus sp. SM2101]